MRLELSKAAVGYAGRAVLSDVSFVLEGGQIGCLLGPSGSGKTTLLRAVAGFEPLQNGEIRGDGGLLSGRGIHLPPEQRRIGMVFQDHALLPHLTALENVRLGLFSLPREAAKARCIEMLSLVGLADQAQRYPHQLSGGQQQRVALARALAPEPRLVLFDEPFASLDPELRSRLARDVRLALKDTGTSALLVTHSQAEAFAMADIIGLVGDGRLHQWDTATALYQHPATRFVAGFVGEGVVLTGAGVGNGRVRCVLGDVAVRDATVRENVAVDLLVRPENVGIVPVGISQGYVTERQFRGATCLCTLRLEGGTVVQASVNTADAPCEGETVGLMLSGPIATVPQS